MAVTINFRAEPFEVMLESFAKDITYTPVTTRVNNSGGDEKLTEGTAATIKGVFYKRENVINPQFLGMFLDADAVLLVKKTVTITRNSYITFDNEKFQIRADPIKRYLGSRDFYFMVRLYKYD